MQKRSSEKPEETKARVGKERKEWEAKLKGKSGQEKKKETDQRKKDEIQLKALLEKKKLPLIGLDGVSSEKDAKTSKSKSKDDDGAKDEKAGKEKKSFGSKVKRLFLGRQLSDALDRKKAEDKGEKPVVAVTTTLPREGGPGWKPADDAVAQAAIAGGAARAEAMGNQMAADRRAGR